MEYKYGKYRHITDKIDPLSVIFEEIKVLKLHIAYAKRNFESVTAQLEDSPKAFTGEKERQKRERLHNYKRSMERNQGILDRYEHHLRILEDNGYLSTEEK